MSLPALWGAVEADFQRDYGIDLSGGALETLSWRRFRALLDHLSPIGAVAACYRAAAEEADPGTGSGRRKAEAELFFRQLAGTGGRNRGA